jgi:ribosomal protein L29
MGKKQKEINQLTQKDREKKLKDLRTDLIKAKVKDTQIIKPLSFDELGLYRAILQAI